MKKESTRSPTLINRRRKISCYKFNLLELLSTKIDFFQQLLKGWRTTVYKTEIELAEISQKDKVLFIGSGFFPYAATLIAEETKAKVISIDNDEKTIKSAKAYIEKNGLSHLITIEYGDGLTYPVQDFDVIFIAINVWPIDQVLEHIHSQMKTDARVLCKCFRNDIATILELDNLSGKFLVKSVLQNPKSHSYLLLKNNPNK